jgi:hypothetical protein
MGSNLERTKKLFAALAPSDAVALISDERLGAEAAAALDRAIAPAFTFGLVAPAEVGTSAEYTGVDGLVEGWSDWLAPFEHYRIDVERMREMGNTVFVTVRMAATPRGASAAIETDAAAVLFFERGLVRRIEFHLDPALARRRAGIAGA